MDPPVALTPRTSPRSSPAPDGLFLGPRRASVSASAAVPDPKMRPEDQNPVFVTPMPDEVVLTSSDDIVADMPSWRRWVILFVVCWMALPMTFMSTSIMAVTVEIAETFDTTPTTVTTANAGVLVAMALSALIWVPLSTILGRRTAYLVATGIMGLGTVGCAVSNNMACLTALWVLTGTTGPFFLTAGQTILSDIFEPAVRGTAVGFFLGSCVSAQSITPLFSSIIATYTSWRVIFGVSAGITFWGGGMAFFFVPKRSQLSHLAKEQDEKKRKKLEADAAATAGGQDPRLRRVKAIVLAFNPMTVFRQWKYPSILLANLACGFLAINQYGLVVSVRHIINPRFQLTSPLYSGMFYLAPGVGFLLGSLVGGNVSDRFVRRYKAKRGGVRLPEDRLNSNLLWSLAVLPLGTLVYGWSVDKGVGGLGLPISFSFVQGFGLMAAFSVLNTYAAEVNPEFKMAIISGKYVVQYSIGAIAVGVVVPMIDAIGSGWTFTMCAIAAIISGCCVIIITRLFVRDAPGIPRTKASIHSGKISSRIAGNDATPSAV